jgi:outer membrane protein assembly factor BamB
MPHSEMPSLISRRSLLKAGAAAGLLPLTRYADAAGFLRRGSFSFAYFSDTHVALARNIKECRDLMLEMRAFEPVLAVNGGDVTDYGWKIEYDNYDSVLEGLPWRTYHVPGNHDVRWSPLGLKIFRDRVGEPYQSFEQGGCLFALLDSTVPLSHWGHYESGQLRWLESELKRVGREMPVFLFTHHWVGRERMMIDNEARLIELIEPHNVKVLFTGHGHSDLLWETDGVASVMLKGLYQGSYMRCEIDQDAQEVRLSRRTAERTQLRPLAAVPLKALREKRPVWAVSSASIQLFGADEEYVVPVRAPGAAEMRWNDDPQWQALPAPLSEQGHVPLQAAAIPGHNVLWLRESARGRQQALDVLVEKPNARIQPRWSVELSGGVMSHLKLDSGRLFVSAMDGSVYALDARSGRTIWRAKTGDYCHSSPVLSGDRVVVGSADSNAYCYDRATGREIWKFKTGGPVYASAAVVKGICAIASGDGRVYGLDERSGEMRWAFELPESNSSFAQSPAATDGERVFIGAWDSHLYALDLSTGQQVWRQKCAERSFAFSPAIGGPAVGNGNVFVPANGNELYCFDCVTGELQWKYMSPGEKVGYSSPRLVGNRIYIGCLGDFGGEFRCISARSGLEMWMTRTGSVIYDSSPAVSDGLVSVGSVNGTLTVMEMDRGEIVAQYRMPTGHFLSSPAAGDGWIYAGTYSDRVLGFRIVR